MWGMKAGTNIFWGKHFLPQVGSFVWLATKRRILTDDMWERFSLHDFLRCNMCRKEYYDANHLLLNFKVAYAFWAMVKGNLGWHGPLPNTLKDFFIFFCYWPHKVPNFPSHVSSKYRKNEHNRHIFQGRNKPIDRICSKFIVKLKKRSMLWLGALLHMCLSLIWT